MRYFDQKGKVGGSGGKTTKAGRAKLYAKLKPEDIVAMEANSLAFVQVWAYYEEGKWSCKGVTLSGGVGNSTE